MHIIDAHQKNSKRKCGETVKNLPIYAVALLGGPYFERIFPFGAGSSSDLRAIFPALEPPASVQGIVYGRVLPHGMTEDVAIPLLLC